MFSVKASSLLLIVCFVQTSKADDGKCPDGSSLAGPCIDGLCPVDYTCVTASDICCTSTEACPNGGAPTVDCAVGTCPQNQVCNTATNKCCPTAGCPDGWHSSQVVSNKCYYVAAQKNIWFDAEAFCTKAGPNAHLTSITSAFENANVDAVVISTPSVSDCDQFWIGGNDIEQDGQFVWVDGSPWGYTKWAQGQPDTTQQCISSTARTNGQWRTEPCGIKNCFICEMYMSG